MPNSSFSASPSYSACRQVKQKPNFSIVPGEQGTALLTLGSFFSHSSSISSELKMEKASFLFPSAFIPPPQIIRICRFMRRIDYTALWNRSVAHKLMRIICRRGSFILQIFGIIYGPRKHRICLAVCPGVCIKRQGPWRSCHSKGRI